MLRRWSLALPIVGLVALGASSCLVEPKPAVAASKPNVLLILVDTMRADALGAHASGSPLPVAVDAVERLFAELALPRRLRYRLAPAMAKEFFKAHFFPREHGRLARLTNSLNYYLASLFFNAFPLPQREAGARQTLRYIGELLAEGTSVLIFPEGRRSERASVRG